MKIQTKYKNKTKYENKTKYRQNMKIQTKCKNIDNIKLIIISSSIKITNNLSTHRGPYRNPTPNRLSIYPIFESLLPPTISP